MARTRSASLDLRRAGAAEAITEQLASLAQA
jgi:DNA-binding TFAR19-related protein (PDSD5 family)